MHGNCRDRLPVKRLSNPRPAPCQFKEIRTTCDPRTYGAQGGSGELSRKALIPGEFVVASGEARLPGLGRLAKLVTKRPRPGSSLVGSLNTAALGGESLAVAVASIECTQPFRVDHIEVLFDVDPGYPLLLCHQTRLQL